MPLHGYAVETGLQVRVDPVIVAKAPLAQRIIPAQDQRSRRDAVSVTTGECVILPGMRRYGWAE
jgi:hypothetical protein